MELKDIIKGIEVELVGAVDPQVVDMQFDSRKVSKGTLFVAQRGTKVDGHDYIEGAVEKGAVAVVCEVLPKVLKEVSKHLSVKFTSTGK